MMGEIFEKLLQKTENHSKSVASEASRNFWEYATHDENL